MNRLREIREAAGLTQEDLAERVKTSQAQIARLEKSKRKLSVEWLERLAKALGTNPWDLIWDVSREREIPISGYVGAGQEVIPLDDLSTSEYADTIEVPAAMGEIAAVQVRGDSMEPVYRDGDIIIYRKVRAIPARMIGRECVVRLTDGRMFVKKLGHGSRKGKYSLYSYNSEPIIDAEIDWVAPVEWVRRKL